MEWIAAGIEHFEGRPLAGRGDQAKEGSDDTAEKKNSTPCAAEPCGENAVCWNSG